MRHTFLRTLAGAGGPHWIATLGGSDLEVAYGIAVDANSNVIIAGYTFSEVDSNRSAYLAKYDNLGALQWQRSLGTSSADAFNGVGVDSSGNIYAAGYSQGISGSQQYLIIAKYNGSGVLQWQRSLGTTNADTEATAIAVGADGTAYVCGRISDASNFSSSGLLVKYNSSGTLQWQKTLGADSARSEWFDGGIALDGSGNVYTCGRADRASTGNDIWITKYNSSGALQWQRVLGSSASDKGAGIAVDGSGNVYISGTDQSNPDRIVDLLIAKYNTSGALQWQRSLYGTSSENARQNSVAVDADSNVYVAAYTNSQGAGSYDGLIVKYNSSGTIQWQRTLGSSAYEDLVAIAVDASGDMYATGTCVVGGNQQILTVKLPANGSKTGTYGGFTYAASTLTDAAGGFTDAAASFTAADGTRTDASASLADAARTLTPSTTIF